MLHPFENALSDKHLCIEKLLVTAAEKGLFHKAFNGAFHRTFHHSLDVILVADKSRTINLANEAAFRLFGESGNHPAGRKCFDVFKKSAGCETASDCFIHEVLATGKPYKTSMDLVGANGEAVHFSVNASPIFENGKDVRNIIIILRDITFQKRLLESDLSDPRDEERKKSGRFLRTVMNSLGEGVVILDPDYRIADANNSFLTTLGYSKEEVEGKHCYTISHAFQKPCWKMEGHHDCPVKVAFDTGLAENAVHIHRDSQGRRLYVEVSAFPLKNSRGEVTQVIETHRDVTEKRELENRLIQAQKMEALGTLAGGIAHDFNNILTPILGHAQLAMRKIGREDPLYKHVQEIQDSADRAANIIRQILAFSRRQILERKIIDLNTVIDQFSVMLKRLIREDVILEILLDKDLWPVSGDSGQIEQILMNLAVNARDAILNGGTLLVETRNVDNVDGLCQTCGEQMSGPHVLLMVSDSGAGMDAETQRRIFEPFFTTKPEGEGTGLGLSTVLGIMHQHNGHINVYSEPGLGSTFNVYFPKASSRTDDIPEVSSATGKMTPGTGTILFVEDDPFVRNIGETILSDSGYTVLTAENGREALAVFEKTGDSVDLLLTDVVMPEIGGWELAERIRTSRPDIPVVFTSGYSFNAALNGMIGAGAITFIQKPFSVDTLTRIIREALDS